MNIILADDNKIFREALVMFLETELQHTVLSDHSNGIDLLYDKKIVNADIVLLDIEMPVLSGIQTMNEINKQLQWIKAIAITNHYEIAHIEELIYNGFKGCLFKDSIFDNLYKSISTVHNGGISFPARIT